MRVITKILAVVVLVCFGLNNISFASEINSFKLSPPSSFSNLKGLEFKEAAQIQIGIRTALKELQVLNIGALKSLGSRPFAERTVFTNKVSGTIYFKDSKKFVVQGQKMSAARVYMVKAVTSSGKIYYSLISKANNGNGHDISVVSDRVLAEIMQKDGLKFKSESVDNSKDKDIIDLYTEHEVSTENNIAIDEWIRLRMERGEYAADDLTGKEGPLYQNPTRNTFNRENLIDILSDISKYLETLGIKENNIQKILDSLLAKPFVLIPYESATDLPVLGKGNGEIIVTAHSSPFATYIFVPKWQYDYVVKQDTWSDIRVIDNIKYELIHEIGAVCGLKSMVKDRRFLNALDEYFILKDVSKGESEELKDLAPVNLLELELRNDYAAGKTAEKKSIFKRVVSLFVICAIAGGGWLYHRLTSEKQDKAESHVKTIDVADNGTNISGASTKAADKAIELQDIARKEELIKYLKNPERKQFALITLAKLGKRAVPYLVSSGLKNEDADVRKGVIDLLAIMGGKDELPILVGLLNNADDDVVSRAIVALGVIGGREINRIIIDFLRNETPDSGYASRLTAIVVLGVIGDENSLAILDEIAKGKYKDDTSTRKAANHAIDDINEARSAARGEMEKLVNFLIAQDTNARIYDTDIKEFAIFSLVRIGQEAVKPLAEVLLKEGGKEDKGYISNCLAAMAIFGNINAVEPLKDGLKSKDWDVRSRSAEALGYAGTQEVLPLLEEATRDEDSDVREDAKDAIERIKKLKEQERVWQEGAKEPQSSINDPKAMPSHIKSTMDGIGMSIPAVAVMNVTAPERVDQITEVLWKAGLGAMSKAEASAELAKLTPEVGRNEKERNAIYERWIAMAASTMIAMSIKWPAKYEKPSDDNIASVASRIKDAGVEIFIRKSQFPGDTISKYRGVMESIGGKLRIYQNVEDLQSMIINPEKSIVMAVDISDEDARVLETLKAKMEELRFMSFAKMDDLNEMTPEELDNYEAEMLGILLVARIITAEDFQDRGSPTYRLLSHLLEDYMPDGVSVDGYIEDIVNNAARLVKTILKALPIAVYKAMRQSVEVLWSA